MEMEEARKSPRVRLVNRRQLLMRTIDVERLIEEDHPARAVWEFTGRLDLSRYYEEIEAVEGVAGRSALDPRMMMSVWIYAYSEGVGSAREIARLCQYHPAYQWLTGMQSINHHSLSDFRVRNHEQLDEVFVNALGLLSAEGLITLERVTQDGTKIKANAGGDTFRREEHIRKHLEMAQQQLEAMGNPESEEVSLRRAKARQRVVRERQQRLASALQELERLKAEKEGEIRVSTTDPEARVMKQPDGGFAPSYNTQICTDAAQGVIVAVEVTQAGNDFGQLVRGVESVEENLGRPPDQVVADGGFTTRENILEMADRHIDFIGSLSTKDGTNRLKALGVDPAFYPDAFRYNEGDNTYTCPAGNTLKVHGKEKLTGYTVFRYQAQASDCQACPFKAQCCPKSKKGRGVTRREDAPVVAAFIDKMNTDTAKEIYRQRSRLAEFPNAWIKDKIGLRQFSVRGLLKAGMEALWACLTYNIQVWIRLRWRQQSFQGVVSS